MPFPMFHVKHRRDEVPGFKAAGQAGLRRIIPVRRALTTVSPR